MTRADIAATLATLTFSCKGRLSSAAVAHKARLLARPDTRALADLIDRANRGRSETDPIVILVEPPAHPRLPPLAHLSNGGVEPYQPRPPCGSPFLRALLLAGAFDGQVHRYTCPECGVVGIYQAPSVDE